MKYNSKKEKLQPNTERLQSLITDLRTNKIRLNKINQEKGASTWLSTLPLKEEEYNLSKQEFGDLFFKKKKLGFTPCKAEQPLQGMELQGTEAQKD